MKFKDLKIGTKYKTASGKEYIKAKPHCSYGVHDCTCANTRYDSDGASGFEWDNTDVTIVSPKKKAKKKTTKPLTFGDLPIGAFYKDLDDEDNFCVGESIFLKIIQRWSSDANAVMVKEHTGSLIKTGVHVFTAPHTRVKRIKRVES